MTLAFGDDEEERFADEDWAHALGGVQSCLTSTARSSPMQPSSNASSGWPTGRCGRAMSKRSRRPRQAGPGSGLVGHGRGERPHPRRVRAGCARDGQSGLLRASRLADLAGADVREDGGGTGAHAGRGRRDHGARHPEARRRWTSGRRSAASGEKATSGRQVALRGRPYRSRAASAQGINGGGMNVEPIETVRPPSAIDAAAPSRMSTTWAACSALARCGRPSAIAAAISATPRAHATPRYAGRTGATGS